MCCMIMLRVRVRLGIIFRSAQRRLSAPLFFLERNYALLFPKCIEYNNASAILEVFKQCLASVEGRLHEGCFFLYPYILHHDGIKENQNRTYLFSILLVCRQSVCDKTVLESVIGTAANFF